LKKKKKKGQACTLTGREIKVGKRNDHRRSTVVPPPTHSTPKGRAHDDTSSDMKKGHFLNKQ
jgi:hypothetical protein